LTDSLGWKPKKRLFRFPSGRAAVCPASDTLARENRCGLVPFPIGWRTERIRVRRMVQTVSSPVAVVEVAIDPPRPDRHG